MKFLPVLALSTALYAVNVVAQFHIRCQNTIGAVCGDSSRPREYNCCDYGYCQPWNSGYYQCINRPDRCPTQETDIDYAGNDIKTIYGLQPDKCCDACAETPGCTVYTFVNQNPDGRTACYLKRSAAGRVEKKGAVSGALSTIPPPANCPVQERGFDYFGNDLKTVFNVGPDECCDECAKTPRCVAYTYIERGDPDGRMLCYLKTSAAGRVAKVGAISGKVKDPATTAPPTLPPPPENCPTQEVNVDYFGNDIRTLNGVTQTACCDACTTTPACMGYTFIPNDKACYLKSSTLGKVAKTGAVSGTVRYIKPPQNCRNPELNIEYEGNNIKEIKGLTYGQCCDACGATAGCSANTWLEAGQGGKSSCWLKSKAIKKIGLTGAISSVYSCPTPVFGGCGSAASGTFCCPLEAYCQPWNSKYYQCMPIPAYAKCRGVVSGVDFYGGDIDVKYGLQPSGCCDACFNNKDCVVYTFVNENPDGRTACYLKNKLVEQRAKPGAISGYKTL